MLKEVELENWRSHSKNKFEFSKGTNALIGMMGSGKSSVLSAISFALFGTFPALKSREITLDETIMTRPQRKQEARVKVEFNVNGDRFEVERKIERENGTTLSRIKKNGSVLDSGVRRTTELVEKFLKMDYDLFSRAVYSEQNGLDYFLEIPKGQRMKKIDHLLRIDRFEKARSNVTTLINKLKTKSEEKENLINQIEEKEDFSRIDELKKKIEKIESEIEEEKKRLKILEEREKEVKEKLKTFKAEREEIEKLKKDKNQIQGTLNSLREDVENLSKNLGELKNKEIEEVEKKMEELNKRKGKTEGKIEGKKKEREELKEKKHKLKATLNDLKKRTEKLSTIEGKCPICDNELTEEHRSELVKERKTKMEAMEDKIEKIEDKLEDKKGEKEEVEKQKQEIEDKLNQKEKATEKLKELKDKVGKKEAYKQQKKNVEEKLEEKEEKFKKEKVDQLQDKLREISSKQSETKSDLKNNKKFLSERRESLKELRERRKLFENYKKEIQKLKFLSQDVKKFRTALEKTQSSLRENFIEAVNSTMNEIWDDLYPYRDYIGIQLAIKEGDYLLELEERSGEWVSVEGVVSGGERTSACLALRIAFALVLAPNLKWLVLDEPTHNLDLRGVEDLATTLRERVNKFVDQVFLITHEEKLEDAVTGNLYKLKRNKEENEPTQINKIE